jgi:hypothetical protein
MAAGDLTAQRASNSDGRGRNMEQGSLSSAGDILMRQPL